jgi:ABC-type phosphate transport system substrate-binding protein
MWTRGDAFMKKSLHIFLVSVAASVLAISAHAQVVIIANNSVRDTSASKADIRDVFMGGSSNLKNGTHVVPILLKGGAAHVEFLVLFIGRSDAGFQSNWKSLVFSGQSSMPRSVDSESAMVQYVETTPGAIGYVLKTTPHDGVKTLTVQ